MTFIDRLYADTEARAARVEGISIAVDADDLAAAAHEAGMLGRRLGEVIHAEVIPGTTLVEVVFRDLGPVFTGQTTKGRCSMP